MGAAAVVANPEGLTDSSLTAGLLGGELEVEIEGDTMWMEGPASYEGKSVSVIRGGRNINAVTLL